MAWGSSAVERKIHNLEAVGSIPAPTIFKGSKMTTTRTESINAIAAASSPAVGLGILELIPIIEAAIQVLSACSGPETPEQFVAVHTNADGTFSHVGVARLRHQIRVEASRQGHDLTRQQADAIAVNMFREGGKHKANLGAVMRGE